VVRLEDEATLLERALARAGRDPSWRRARRQAVPAPRTAPASKTATDTART
jgi:hypothetical protein